VTPPATNGSVPPRLKARVVVGRVGATVRLAYRALDDGAGVREKVSVSAKKTVVFRTTTGAGQLHAGQLYYVLWRPKKQHGRFIWCVTSVAADATRSPQSCSTVTLR